MSAPPSAAISNLLQPPSTNHAQQAAIQSLSAKVGPSPVGSKLDSSLAELVSHARASAVAPDQLAQSGQQIHQLLSNARTQLETVHTKMTVLKAQHDRLEDRLIDHHELLVSSFSQRELHSTEEGTLRERLEALSIRRKELQLAREWFQILAKTEELG